MGRSIEEKSENGLSVVFWGHACVGLHLDGSPFLLIDPFDPKGLGGTQGPAPVPVEYPYVVATHDHSDHAAFHTQPGSQVLGVPCSCGPLRIDYRVAAHDPLGGRLRGGSVRILEIRTADYRIIHCSDLGERPLGDLLEWLSGEPIDLMIVPAGGYFTLNADGAVELVARVQPKRVLFCHTADDGLPLPQMDPRSIVRQRSAHIPSSNCSEISLRDTPSGPTHIFWMERPDEISLGRNDG